MVRKIAILGSTGSIGTNALKIAQHLGEEVQVKALSAHTNIDLLEAQARLVAPELIGVYDKEQAQKLQKRLPHIPVLGGMEGLEAVASYDNVDMVLSAMSGTMGILPTIAAIQKGKQIALANKEVLVSAGEYVTTLIKQSGSVLIPVDSEHTAIFQCLQGSPPHSVRRLILTASGGPFYHSSLEELSQITVDQALCHPNYRMGIKNTIDSSTLMNKGLEVIEAHWLFNVPIDQIEVVVHPQQIIHSLVEFIDGSMLAQLSEPTMLIPIQYALTYPHRRPGLLPPFDFTKHPSWHFSAPDQKFICLNLAYEALRQGGSLPCYLNAANEILVSRFIKKEIGWLEIAQKLETLLSTHSREKELNLEKILEIDALARREALVI